VFGFVAGGAPHPTRWGNGSDGDATWSGTVTKQGIYQFKTLTISASAVVKCGTSGLMQNGLVVFANRAINIGNSVEINAQPNSDTYQGSSSWQATGADTTDTHAWTGGAGGGGYGTNCSGDPGLAGNNPQFYYTTTQGTVYGSSIVDYGGAAAGGAGGNNSGGVIGSSGVSAVSTDITNNFGFTLATVSGHDDFPVVFGGDGGQGGGASSCSEVKAGGNGGTGGGMILLIAPTVTFGTSVTLNAYGCTRNEGGGSNCGTGAGAWKNMGGNELGDGGSGGGGGGGGGLVAVIYNAKTGSYTSDVSGGVGGYGYGHGGSCGGGNHGGYGGTGGNGVSVEGSRGYMAGGITWI